MYCKDKDRAKDYSVKEFDFLGYTYKAIYIKCRDGKMRRNFIASVSKKSAKGFIDKIKGMELLKKTGSNITMIAEMTNPIIRGWINYFAKYKSSTMKFSLDCIERRLIRWAMRKYRNFRGRRQLAEKWFSEVKRREPNLFARWKVRCVVTG